MSENLHCRLLGNGNEDRRCSPFRQTFTPSQQQQQQQRVTLETGHALKPPIQTGRDPRYKSDAVRHPVQSRLGEAPDTKRARGWAPDTDQTGFGSPYKADVVRNTDFRRPVSNQTRFGTSTQSRRRSAPDMNQTHSWAPGTMPTRAGIPVQGGCPVRRQDSKRTQFGTRDTTWARFGTHDSMRTRCSPPR